MPEENKADVLASQENKLPPYKKGFQIVEAYCCHCRWCLPVAEIDSIRSYRKLHPLEYDAWQDAVARHDIFNADRDSVCEVERELIVSTRLIMYE